MNRVLQLWSRIRNAPLAVTEVARSAAISMEDTLAQPAAHLEYLGYEIQIEPDGWTYAQHPYRYNLHLRTSECGVRLYCWVPIGASIENSRGAWLDYLNTRNDRGHLTRFSLVEDEAGGYGVRMRALISGAYSRSVFATVMDMWHEDLALIQQKPEFPRAGSRDRSESTAAVTVN